MQKIISMIVLAVALLLPMNESEASMTATDEGATNDVKQSTNVSTNQSVQKKWNKRHHYNQRPNHQQAETNQKPTVEVEQPSTSQPEEVAASDIEQQVLALTNEERAKAGLKPLQLDDQLMASARAKSLDMAKNHYFSHTSPTYGSPFDQMKQYGVTYRAAAENIAKGQRSAKEVVQAWMDSPGHRQNILTPNFTHIGIGYAQSSNVWTQQFIEKR